MSMVCHGPEASPSLREETTDQAFNSAARRAHAVDENSALVWSQQTRGPHCTSALLCVLCCGPTFLCLLCTRPHSCQENTRTVHAKKAVPSGLTRWAVTIPGLRTLASRVGA